MKINKYSLFFVVLLVFSFVTRIYKINNLSLFGDEIDVGYQAFSLLTTQHDYKGNYLPFYIQSLSESRAPLLIYTSIPGIAIFGFSELGVRITPIIFGVLSIYLFYKLILLLSKSNSLALISSTALSLSPWHFHYSRTSFEVTLLLSLILGGTFFVYKYFDTSKNKFLYLSILIFCLSFYTYNIANIFVPLMVIFLFFSNFSKLKSKINLKSFIISLFIFLITVLPLLYQIFFGSAANRFNLISIFHDPKIINTIIDKRTSFSAMSPSLESFFHNKPIAWTQELVKNYLSSFSLPFLFNFGDQLNLRHSVPGFGLLFISFLPFLIIGLFSLNLKEKINQLMLSWLLISPIAASLTINGSNHATRLFLMLPSLSYFIGLGIFKIIYSHIIIKKIILFICAFTLLFEIFLYSHEYFIHYPKDSFESWNYGYKEIFQNIPLNSSNRVFISNAKYNSLLPFLFYQNYPLNSKNIINDLEIPNIFEDLSGFFLYPNIYFINDWQSQNDTLQKISQFAQKGDTFILFQLKDIPGDINLYQKPLDGFHTIRTIYQPNNTILAQIIQKE
jgi:hypothetical protein